jgi:hypothetical protein
MKKYMTQEIIDAQETLRLQKLALDAMISRVAGQANTVADAADKLNRILQVELDIMSEEKDELQKKLESR